MSTQPRTGWAGGWTAQDPAEIGYVWAPNDGGTYEAVDGGISARDLGVARVSDGRIDVRRERIADPAQAARWRSLDADLDVLYVLRGDVTVENGRSERVPMRTGSVAIHPRGLPYRFIDASDDFEAVHIVCPAGAPVRFDDAEPTTRTGASYSDDTDDRYVQGDGPRAYFRYRDLGTRAATDGRMHLHIVRATQPGEGTGWHYHTMAQWFMVIGGTAAIRVEDRPSTPLAWGDSMCVGRGPRMRHNVTDFSADYLVLEMCVPAVYDTIAVDAPEGADAP